MNQTSTASIGNNKVEMWTKPEMTILSISNDTLADVGGTTDGAGFQS